MGANFQTEARRARQAGASPARCAGALVACAMCHAYLTQQSFEATLVRLGERFGYKTLRDASLEQLMASLNQLEVERNLFLQRLRVFERRRVARKHCGQRAPSSSEVKRLYLAQTA